MTNFSWKKSIDFRQPYNGLANKIKVKGYTYNLGLLLDCLEE